MASSTRRAGLKGTIDGWLDTIESLDPSKNLKGVGKVAGTLNSSTPAPPHEDARRGEVSRFTALLALSLS